MIPWSQLANKNLHQYFAMILQLKHSSQIGQILKQKDQIKSKMIIIMPQNELVIATVHYYL
jgi:hypothetical protein